MLFIAFTDIKDDKKISENSDYEEIQRKFNENTAQCMSII